MSWQTILKYNNKIKTILDVAEKIHGASYKDQLEYEIVEQNQSKSKKNNYGKNAMDRWANIYLKSLLRDIEIKMDIYEGNEEFIKVLKDAQRRLGELD